LLMLFCAHLFHFMMPRRLIKFQVMFRTWTSSIASTSMNLTYWEAKL